MKRVWGHVLMPLSLVAGVSAAFSACVHDDSTIFVQNVLAPQTSSQAGSLCVYTPDPTQAFISSGVLDLALRPQYKAMFLLGNQMVAQANSSQLQTETSIAKIEHAVVRITTFDGNEQLARYTEDTEANVPPASGDTPGYSTIGRVTIVDPQTAASPAVQQHLVPGGTVRLVTYVRFEGTTLGGQAVESNEFQFPVDVCYGCLITFTNDPRYPIPNCVGSGAASTSNQPLIPCGDTIGQDIPIDCSSCESLGEENCRGAYVPTQGSADAGSD
jgi:hypothetical protein